MAYLFVERMKSIQGASRLWALCRVLLVVALFGSSLMACSCDPPKTGQVIKTISITSPTTGGIFNATNDGDTTRAGIQVDVKVALGAEGEGDFPTGLQVTLTTNGKREATVAATGAEVLFPNYTLEEGNNTLQASVKLADGTVLNSANVQLTSDSQCYQIEIISPKKDAVLGGRDDENSSKAGFQQTVLVRVGKDAVEPIKLTIKDEAGQEQTIERKPFEGEVAFDEVDLPEGKVTLTASITDAAGNLCSATSELTVKFGAPAVSISEPADGKQLCPQDDADPNTAGFQVDVKAKTSAEDKSEATLFLDGLRNGSPTVVANGEVSFRITLPALDSTVESKVKVKVTDTLGNDGESAEQTIKARTRGYDLTFVGIIDGQNIPDSRDEDPNKAGLQLSIRVSTSAPDGVDHTLDFDGTPLTAKSSGGIVSYTLDLKSGQNCLTASVTEAGCSIKSETQKVCISVKPPDVPTLVCTITELRAPRFDSVTKATQLNATHDTDAQATGVQNNITCQTDAEKDQTLTIDLNGATQNATLVDAAGGMLREATFTGLTFNDGNNTLKVSVKNAKGNEATVTYTIEVDISPPTSITDLTASVEDNRNASVKLSFTAPSDGADAITDYEIRYSYLLQDKDFTVADWEKPDGKFDGKGTTKPGEKTEILLTGLSVGRTYKIAIRAKDAAGNLSASISNIVTVAVDFKSNKSDEPGTGKTLFGYVIIAAGDLDKDGVQDLVVTEPTYSTSTNARAGAVHIYYGRKPSTGAFLPTKPDVTITGDNANDTFGLRAVAMGDLNSDGFSDFAVASPRAVGGQGRVFIFFGGQRGTALKNDTASKLARVVITGVNAGDLFANAMASAGGRFNRPDLNGDNKADLLISAFSTTNTGLTTKGTVYVYYSRAAYPAAGQPPLTLDTTNADLTILNDSEANGPRGTAFFGAKVIARDLDRDGNCDVLISSVANDSIVGFFGPLKPTNKVVKSSAANLKIVATTGGGTFGSEIAIAGDVDNDSKLDLIVSGRGGTGTGQAAGSGQVWVFSGTKLLRGATKLDANKDAAISFYGRGPGSYINTVSTAGDLNGDGYADFMIGEGLVGDPQANLSNTGAVYLYFGKGFSSFKSGKASDIADFTWYGANASAQLGIFSLLGGIDLTGDNKPDIVFAETPPTTKEIKGRIYIKY